MKSNANDKSIWNCEPVTQCRKVLGQIEKVKNAILAEFQGALGEHGNILRLAVKEAEALAWETEYPHLLFPALAAEKAQQLEQWHSHQRQVRWGSARAVLAA